MTDIRSDDWKGEHLIRAAPRREDGRNRCITCRVKIDPRARYCARHKPVALTKRRRK